MAGKEEQDKVSNILEYKSATRKAYVCLKPMPETVN